MILIVDDDSNLAENCSMLLEAYGYEVSTALSGEEALLQIKERQPDLLISDCCMPDLTGLELSQRLNATPSGSPFPILLMSGSLQCQVAATVKSYDAFIKKPFLAESLLSKVQALLARNFLSRREGTQENK
ncbi:two-component system phosphate regulon response regulator PhoB/two-component system response regulator GlrR [Pseudomonas duriflava]|uniref:Two-component system phosphate regulon response regulator PhoB/two-component system response regulator GlrR n=1 Tax=Pseudomonas duriflava TaxID=459528 RepID=A0A562Q971_9PSED|nr:response regulator [Pseudomonas duriflava]TWI52576.1 two-component system phosphate regulon response regulator PhoB/two-component system response regulator GlrR [Pseudomonas duriflava]